MFINMFIIIKIKFFISKLLTVLFKILISILNGKNLDKELVSNFDLKIYL